MNKSFKIRNWVQISKLIVLFNFAIFQQTSAQSKIINKYGLVVINSTKVLQKEINADSSKKMIDLKKEIPGIYLDLKYATRDNFMHKILYRSASTTFLRKPAAEVLKKVVKELKDQNLAIKVFDAYRPYSVTEEMWQKVKDSRYAADPATGSGHNRGVAVDLTLIELETRKELPMGTGFDNFSDTAHSDFAGLSPEILNNRNLLKTVMEKFGFKQLSTEWWHFYIPDGTSFELLDLSFFGLKRMSRKKSSF
ncbi:MAG: M15 family metallopeptidase [Ginsengibacter sp.]